MHLIYNVLVYRKYTLFIIRMIHELYKILTTQKKILIIKSIKTMVLNNVSLPTQPEKNLIQYFFFTKRFGNINIYRVGSQNLRR